MTKITEVVGHPVSRMPSSESFNFKQRELLCDKVWKVLCYLDKPVLSLSALFYFLTGEFASLGLLHSSQSSRASCIHESNQRLTELRPRRSRQ